MRELRMTDERAGQLNEPNLISSVTSEIEFVFFEWNGEDVPDGWSMPMYMTFVATVDTLRKRGLINELGIEILKRDGVIK